jgi:DNA-binding NarL/FixJ family response regulator
MGCGLDHDLPGLAVSDDGRPVRVLVCDDHEVLRHGLRTVLCRVPDLAVVAEAADADEARSLAGTVRPDVALVGLGAQGPVVRDLAREMTGMGIRVVLLGEAGAGSDLVEALRAGVRGYVHTTASPQRLLEGVRAVACGETVLDSCVTVSSCTGSTGRQGAVAELVAEGLTNAEIAARLQVSRGHREGPHHRRPAPPRPAGPHTAGHPRPPGRLTGGPAGGAAHGELSRHLFYESGTASCREAVELLRES